MLDSFLGWRPTFLWTETKLPACALFERPAKVCDNCCNLSLPFDRQVFFFVDFRERAQQSVVVQIKGLKLSYFA